MDSFRTASESAGTGQYSDHFRGLAGRDIPAGEYDARILCGEAEIYKRITVDHSNQFEVVALRGRLLISDHVKTKLVIKLETRRLANEIWWIRMVGMYNSEAYTSRFAPANGEAMVTDPEPGSYLVTVLSTNGYTCTHEVDFAEFTRSWTFHPSGCSFELDQFAHLVREDDKRNMKQGSWYEERREDSEKLLRGLNEAVTKK
jgi:hypothetical protein